MLSDKTVELLIKAGPGTILSMVAGLMLYLGHVEREESRKDNLQKLLPVLEKLAESTESIARTYSGAKPPWDPPLSK